MNVTRRTPAHRDRRGVITDILEGVRVDALTVVTSARGAVRGNHFHKKTTQYLYVLKGRVRVLERPRGGRVQERILTRGDLLVTDPWVSHVLVALAASTFIVATRGPRRGGAYEADTYRLEVPLWPRP